jgi:hypothetical protein
MRFFKSFFNRLSVFKELGLFLSQRKRWWLLPIVVMLVLLGILIVLTETTALGPFIYAIF